VRSNIRSSIAGASGVATGDGVSIQLATVSGDNASGYLATLQVGIAV
jgi:hypothetical protein